MTRNQVIDILEKADSTVYKEPKTKTAYALEYAINSLKTDEAYQLMYEGEEIFTKADVVAILKELQAEIEKIVKEEELINKKWANGLHYSEKIIQQRINKLQTDKIQ